MKTLQFNAYSFTELSDTAKEKARQWWRESDEFNADFVFEDAETIGGFIGLSEMKIQYTGFCSQGDGACFNASWRAADVKPGKLVEYAPKDSTLKNIAADFERIAKEFPHASFTVRQRGYYYHENCTEFCVYISDENDDAIEPPAADQAEKDLIEAAKSFMHWIYRTLEKEYEYQNSDACVDENIIANDYLFTESGKRTVTLND